MIKLLFLEFVEHEKIAFCVVNQQISHVREFLGKTFFITHKALNAKPEFSDNC